MSFNFSSLDLTEVNQESGRRTLAAGDHSCRISDVEIKDTRSGGKMLIIEMTGDGGQKVNDRINIVNNSKEAVEIGRARLKHLLEMAGHPNPNQPKDVNSIKGLSVGVHVVDGADWADNEGMIRKGGGEPRRSAPYFKATASSTSPAKDDDGFGDGIPF